MLPFLHYMLTQNVEITWEIPVRAAQNATIMWQTPYKSITLYFSATYEQADRRANRARITSSVESEDEGEKGDMTDPKADQAFLGGK